MKLFSSLSEKSRELIQDAELALIRIKIRRLYLESALN